jgi:hypothetical protein
MARPSALSCQQCNSEFLIFSKSLINFKYIESCRLVSRRGIGWMIQLHCMLMQSYSRITLTYLLLFHDL